MATLGYKAALAWIIDNDDTQWLYDEDAHGPILSVTAVFLADIYDKDHDKVVNDLRKLDNARKRNER